MVGISDEPLFGSTPMTQAFAKYAYFAPLRDIAIYPGQWSTLMNRASRAQTIDQLSESDRRLLLDAEREAVKQNFKNPV
jgi:hypothetical protein